MIAIASCTTDPVESGDSSSTEDGDAVGEVSQAVEESGGVSGPPSGGGCSTTCDVAGLAACAPFGVVGAVACGLGAIAACNAICADDEKVCINHHAGGDVDGKACISRHEMWWCDPKVDGRRVRAWYKLKDGSTHSPTNDPVATQWAPSQACHRVGFPTAIDVYKFRVCVEGTGCTSWRNAWNGAQLSSADQDYALSVPFWRYFRLGDIDHFYTIWGDHGGLAAMGYGSEGYEGRVFPQPNGLTVPVYRYWNAGIGDHFYTTNFYELGFGAIGYVYEGIEAHIYDEPHAGSIPMHRYYSAAGGDHFYTTAYYPNGMCYGICFAYEGVLGYVLAEGAL